MSGQAVYEKVREALGQLKMEAALAELDEVLERGAREECSAIEVLDTLFERELTARFERRVRVNWQLSGLPVHKRLEDFDYDAAPHVPKRTVEELATLRFLSNGENVLLLGPCGVGKTHIALGLGVRALEQGHRVYFLTLHDMVTKLAAARERGRADRLLNTIHKADLWILDELGFLPLSAADATFLFEAINKRYQARKSTIVTSNKSFGSWGDIFPDTVLATALLDRLLHYAVTVNIRGESFRLRDRRLAGIPEPQEE
jgi:DNA replication protein DnaC